MLLVMKRRLHRPANMQCGDTATIAAQLSACAHLRVILHERVNFCDTGRLPLPTQALSQKEHHREVTLPSQPSQPRNHE